MLLLPLLCRLPGWSCPSSEHYLSLLLPKYFFTPDLSSGHQPWRPSHLKGFFTCSFPSYAHCVLVPLLTVCLRNTQAKTWVTPSFSILYPLAPSDCHFGMPPPAALLGYILVSWVSYLFSLPPGLLCPRLFLVLATSELWNQSWASLSCCTKISLTLELTEVWGHAVEGDKPAEEEMPCWTCHLPSVFLSFPDILILFNLGNGYLYVSVIKYHCLAKFIQGNF